MGARTAENLFMDTTASPFGIPRHHDGATYIPDNDFIGELDAHIAEAPPYLWVIGRPGQGKTSLMAWLVDTRRYCHCFIDRDDPHCGDAALLLQTLSGRARPNVQPSFRDVGDRMTELRQLERRLFEIGQRRKKNNPFVVVIDAVDEWRLTEEDRAAGRSLLDLLPIPPEGVIYLLSSRPGVDVHGRRLAEARRLPIGGLTFAQMKKFAEVLGVKASQAALKRLLEQTERHALYATTILRQVKDEEPGSNLSRFLKTHELPDTVEAYFNGYVKQLLAGLGDKALGAEVVVAALATASVPFRWDALLSAVNRLSPSASPSSPSVAAVTDRDLVTLNQFLEKDKANGFAAFSHSLLKEQVEAYLATMRPAMLRAGHLLNAVLLLEADNLEPEKAIRCAKHLTSAEEEQLLSQLFNTDYLVAQVKTELSLDPEARFERFLQAASRADAAQLLEEATDHLMSGETPSVEAVALGQFSQPLRVIDGSGSSTSTVPPTVAHAVLDTFHELSMVNASGEFIRSITDGQLLRWCEHAPTRAINAVRALARVDNATVNSNRARQFCDRLAGHGEGMNPKAGLAAVALRMGGVPGLAGLLGELDFRSAAQALRYLPLTVSEMTGLQQALGATSGQLNVLVDCWFHCGKPDMDHYWLDASFVSMAYAEHRDDFHPLYEALGLPEGSIDDLYYQAIIEAYLEVDPKALTRVIKKWLQGLYIIQDQHLGLITRAARSLARQSTELCSRHGASWIASLEDPEIAYEIACDVAMGVCAGMWVVDKDAAKRWYDEQMEALRRAQLAGWETPAERSLDLAWALAPVAPAEALKQFRAGAEEPDPDHDNYYSKGWAVAPLLLAIGETHPNDVIDLVESGDVTLQGWDALCQVLRSSSCPEYRDWLRKPTSWVTLSQVRPPQDWLPVWTATFGVEGLEALLREYLKIDESLNRHPTDVEKGHRSLREAVVGLYSKSMRQMEGDWRKVQAKEAVKAGLGPDLCAYLKSAVPQAVDCLESGEMLTRAHMGQSLPDWSGALAPFAKALEIYLRHLVTTVAPEDEGFRDLTEMGQLIGEMKKRHDLFCLGGHAAWAATMDFCKEAIRYYRNPYAHRALLTEYGEFEKGRSAFYLAIKRVFEDAKPY